MGSRRSPAPGQGGDDRPLPGNRRGPARPRWRPSPGWDPYAADAARPRARGRRSLPAAGEAPLARDGRRLPAGTPTRPTPPPHPGTAATIAPCPAAGKAPLARDGRRLPAGTPTRSKPPAPRHGGNDLSPAAGKPRPPATAAVSRMGPLRGRRLPHPGTAATIVSPGPPSTPRLTDVDHLPSDPSAAGTRPHPDPPCAPDARPTGVPTCATVVAAGYPTHPPRRGLRGYRERPGRLRVSEPRR